MQSSEALALRPRWGISDPTRLGLYSTACFCCSIMLMSMVSGNAFVLSGVSSLLAIPILFRCAGGDPNARLKRPNGVRDCRSIVVLVALTLVTVAFNAGLVVGHNPGVAVACFHTSVIFVYLLGPRSDENSVRRKLVVRYHVLVGNPLKGEDIKRLLSVRQRIWRRLFGEKPKVDKFEESLPSQRRALSAMGAIFVALVLLYVDSGLTTFSWSFVGGLVAAVSAAVYFIAKFQIKDTKQIRGTKSEDDLRLHLASLQLYSRIIVVLVMIPFVPTAQDVAVRAWVKPLTAGIFAQYPQWTGMGIVILAGPFIGLAYRFLLDSALVRSEESETVKSSPFLLAVIGVLEIPVVGGLAWYFGAEQVSLLKATAFMILLLAVVFYSLRRTTRDSDDTAEASNGTDVTPAELPRDVLAVTSTPRQRRFARRTTPPSADDHQGDGQRGRIGAAPDVLGLG